MTESIPIVEQLRRLELLLGHVVNDLYNVTFIPCLPPHICRPIHENRKLNTRIAADQAENAARRLLRITSSLVHLAPPGTLTVPKPPSDQQQGEEGEEAPPHPRTFHPFSRLPTELRLLIWEAASLPPACAHYVAQSSIPFRLTDDDHINGTPLMLPLPAASLMPDRGLWTTCHESRDAMKRVYRACHRNVVVHGCGPSYSKFEMHYRRLAYFNRLGRQLQRRIDTLNKRFKSLVPRTFVSLCLVNDLYETTVTPGGLMLLEPKVNIETLFSGEVTVPPLNTTTKEMSNFILYPP